MHDSHTHLSIDPLKTNVLEHIKEFKDNGGKYILNLSHTFESVQEVISQSIEIEKIYPNIVLTGIGIHPEEITGITKAHIYKEIDKYIEVIKENIKNHKKRIFCIGECGLDYYHIFGDTDYAKDEIELIIEAQKYCFTRHVQLALEYNLPMSIHTRDRDETSLCTLDALRIITEIGKGMIHGSFHSYTGSQEVLEEILSLGFHVGYNGIITYPKAENVRRLLEKTPIERILIETDAPLLPPQNVRNGKSGEIKYGKPLDVIEIAQKAAEIKDMEFGKFNQKTLENFQSLFLRN